MLEGILRVLDCVKGIKPAKPDDPPPPPAAYRCPRPIATPEMIALYEELGQEMRALRATEFSVATLFYAVASFLVVANFTVIAAGSLPLVVKAATVVLTVVFLLLLWSHVHGRISHDNHSYSHLLSRRRYLEREWFWENMPGKPANVATGASGPGYRMTQQMLALSVVFVVATLVLVLFLTLNADVDVKLG
ncbi:MAG: hypothetical protein AB7V26_12285 [Lysobacterales bacterium]